MTRLLTEQETLAIRAFQRQVERLRTSPLLQEGKVRFQFSTTVSLESGEKEISFKGYDPIVFQAYLPIFRQFLLNDEINFGRILNILKRRCDREDLAEWVKHTQRVWKATLASIPTSEHPYFDNANDDVEASIKKLFYGYGGLFHASVSDPEEEEMVTEIQESTLQMAFPEFWNCLRNLDSVVHIWLDAPEKTVPPVPDKGDE